MANPGSWKTEFRRPRALEVNAKNVKDTTSCGETPFQSTFDICNEAFWHENAAKSAGKGFDSSAHSGVCPSPPGCSHSGETAEVACERGFRGVECLFRARGGTRGEPDSRFALRLRLFLGSVTQCVAWLWSRTASLPLPPPPPLRPSFKTKLGPSQTLHALFLSLLHSPLFYHLGRSVLFFFVRLLLLTSSTPVFCVV